MRKSYIIGYFPWLMDSFNFFVWIVIIICDFYCMQYAARLCFTNWMRQTNKKCMRTHEFLHFKQSKQFLISLVDSPVMFGIFAFFAIYPIFTIFTISTITAFFSSQCERKSIKLFQNTEILNYACNFCYSLNRVLMLLM